VSRATQQLHDLGQSLWLDNITRTMLDDGTIARLIAECSVTGLTSNPSIFDKAIASGAYDGAIRAIGSGRSAEEVFFELAIEDLQRAADLFRPAHDSTGGVDGFVSLEVSPELARDTTATVAAAKDLHARAGRPNVFIKIPGTPEGLPAIEESIFSGVPVNVTLLFDAAQYEAAADAYLRGVERRIEAGLDPAVESVASIFMSRWDVAVAGKVPAELENRLAIAVGQAVYRSYRTLLGSDRYQRVLSVGGRSQRVLWASTSAKNPGTADDLYVRCLAAPDTVNTMPDSTLAAFYDHGSIDGTLPADGGDCDALLASFAAVGINTLDLATTLQVDGAAAFVDSWRDLISHVAAQITAAG
jgi:transaldolase